MATELDPDLLEFTRKLPKVELHAHLNGSLSVDTLRKLIDLKSKTQPEHTANSPSFNTTDALSLARHSPTDLSDVFRLFGLIQSITTTTAAIRLATADVVADFAADSVKWLEIRTTPRVLNDGKASKLDYLKAVGLGIQDYYSERQSGDGEIKDGDSRNALGIRVGVLVSIDRRRSLEEAWENLEAAVAARDQHSVPVVGMDLSGDPSTSDARLFLPVLEKARTKYGLKAAVHLAEIAGSEWAPEIEEVIMKFGPDRIGHGTFIHEHKDPIPDAPATSKSVPISGGTAHECSLNDGESDLSQRWTAEILRRKIPIELCLSSNVIGGTVKAFSDHHVNYWLKQGAGQHPIVICTDDKGVFSTSLSKEYAIVGQHIGLTKEQLWECSFRAIDACFCSDDVTAELKQVLEVAT